ncbi:MAG: hypothetical protein K2X35_05330 [Bryobacteraceae bacterium]|nr:hypothetical protein [Bryobacteraceae bacterium]
MRLYENLRFRVIPERAIASLPAMRITIALLALPLVAAPRPTFTEDVAPIVFSKCAACHRPGEAAPFALLSYDDVKKRGPMLAGVTKARLMPPWHADEGWAKFRDERRLSEAEIATFQNWVKSGMPEGPQSKLPKLPEFPRGWQLGKPDLVLTMERGFEVPADGPDIYRNFVLKLNLPEDKWVKAIELRPSARAVVHHVLYFLDNTGAARRKDGADGKPGFGGMTAGVARGGSLGGWAVGASPRRLPEDLALPLPQGSDIVLQSHFHPTGKMETEQTTIGLYFADKPPSRTLTGVQVPALFGFGAGIDIPAGEADYRIRDSFTLPVDVDVFGAGAHAHYLAKTMRLTATLPDGTSKAVLGINDWDFAWQDQYYFEQPFRLPKGARVDVEIRYDNSTANPRNPQNPPQRVQWGEGSFDEMGSMSLIAVPARESDLAELREALQKHRQAAISGRIRQGVGQLLR